MSPALVSLSKQNLLLEFATLRHACPEGIFVTIIPGNPWLWAGILFVRSGPYMPSVLRFQMSFPNHFPDQPPLITFSSDVFHPLLTPLTTHSYSSVVADDGNKQSIDERLPPGGFSLRYGFPHWFSSNGEITQQQTDQVGKSSQDKSVSVLEILQYLQTAFNDEKFLDNIPLEATADPGAYHAWHTFQARRARLATAGTDNVSKRNSVIAAATADGSREDSDPNTPSRGRRLGQWNWDGVWEDRVRRGIQSTISEQALFGTSNIGDEIIRFSNLDSADFDAIVTELDRQNLAKEVPA